jgi:hypothetical protein
MSLIMEGLNLKNVNDVEDNEHDRLKISDSFAALESWTMMWISIEFEKL